MAFGVLYSCSLWALDGFLEPTEEVEISTPETGVIIKKNIKEGLTVKKGTVLVELDSSVLRASLTGTRADYQAKKRKKEEIEKLHKQAIASTEELQSAETQALIALSQYQTLQRQIDRRQIKSPINGVIIEMTRDVGELVSQTQGPFIKIVNISKLKLTVYIPYEKTIDLSLKKILPIKIEGIEKQQEGLVSYISPVVDPASSTVKVELTIDNANKELRSGVPVAVQFLN